MGVVVLGFIIYLLLAPDTAFARGSRYFYLHDGWKANQVYSALSTQGILRHEKAFAWVARRVGYSRHIHSGRYLIRAGMSSFQILRLLRSGRQTPVRLVINSLRTEGDLVSLISRNLETDSGQLKDLLGREDFLRQYGLDSADQLCLVIPDTYEFYWNSSADRVVKKLARAYRDFWDSSRITQARAIGLEPPQVVVLASIVEQETNKDSEKPRIAAVYLNRMKKGIRLAADPTVKFALGDYTIRRIYGKFTQVNSPYNTYMHSGLPPGPICIPSRVTVDAVLHSPSTDDLYFCARPDFSGYHVFAATLAAHKKNARRYQHALDSLNIK
ncbi:MAG TPA: endolytic transglycosylase MltG [Chitinophagaceae bacterium]|nr:endolytic transglycosylase MltG [Chitinophagaceae bacterium]